MSLVGFSELIDVGVDQLVIGLGGGPGIGTSYCGPAALNSIGESAEIVATGSTVTSQNDLTLGAIGRLVGNDDVRDRLARGGRARVLEEFSLEHNVARIAKSICQAHGVDFDAHTPEERS